MIFKYIYLAVQTDNGYQIVISKVWILLKVNYILINLTKGEKYGFRHQRGLELNPRFTPYFQYEYLFFLSEKLHRVTTGLV